MSKLALLIGINYIGQSKKLRGCINDVKHVRQMLIEHMGYKDKNIVMMTDDLNPDDENYPTARKILSALRRIIVQMHHSRNKKSITLSREQLDCPNTKKEVWFHFSGHSVSIADKNGDERDGMDEAIVPVDYEKSGVIPDDFLHKYMRYIPKEVNFVSFFDSCHSGTILDLKYRHFPNAFNVMENENSENSENSGKIMMFSGCRDNEKGIGFLENGKNWIGAMTRSMLDTLSKHNYEISCRELLDEMQHYMVKNGFSQRPQLSTNFLLQKYSIFCKRHSEKPFIRVR